MKFEIGEPSAALERPYRGEWCEVMKGDRFLLAGGITVGTAPCGQDRRRFEIGDSSVYGETNNMGKAKIGDVDLLMKGDDIVGLVDIKLATSVRGKGFGKEIVSSLVASAPDGFIVYDIQQKAVAFWRKMGAVFHDRSGAPLASTKGQKFVLGLIQADGDQTPMTSLPGWFPAPK